MNPAFRFHPLLASLHVLVLVAGCSRPEQSPSPAQEAPRTPAEEVIRARGEQTQLVARGKYLATVSACHDCHSPKIMTEHGPEPDPARLLSGHPANEPLPDTSTASKEWISFNMGLTGYVGPWGVTYAANLTPDDTGIGTWNYERFETAIRKGKFKGLEGSRELLPPMPWQMYRNFSDEDLKAIFAYLKSLKPIKNLVPQAHPREKDASVSAPKQSTSG